LGKEGRNRSLSSRLRRDSRRGSVGALVVATLLVCLSACSRPSNAPGASTGTAQKQAAELITIEVEVQKTMQLQVAAARVQTLAEYLQVMGTVQPIDGKVAHIRAMARGRIQQVLVKVGDRVKAGDELARFDNMEAGELLSQLESARAELRRLQIQQAATNRQAERNRRLAEIGAIPQKEHEASQAEQSALAAGAVAQQSVVDGLLARLRRFGISEARPGMASVTAVRSPFAGVVIQAAAAPGDVIAPDSELFEVADLSQVWVQAEVYEKDIGKVRIGQPAIIAVDTYPDQPFAAKVTYMGDALNAKTRTARVRCEAANPAGKLKLDMFASVRLPTTFSRTALAVPSSTILRIGNHDVVFVRKSETTFEPRNVQLGGAANGSTEITGGLSPGEMIVVSGAFHLKSILLSKEIGEE